MTENDIVFGFQQVQTEIQHGYKYGVNKHGGFTNHETCYLMIKKINMGMWFCLKQWWVLPRVYGQ